MPRVARIVIPEFPHHITQRGNNRQDVFFTDDDRRYYLGRLKEQSDKYGLDILGFCLMSNHVHIIGVPWHDYSMHKAVGGAHLIYTQYVNRLHGRSGHLWQNRFYSCALDDAHLILAMAYMERNPVRAGMVRKAWRYEWSSAKAHLDDKDKSGILDMESWREHFEGIDWREFLERPEDKDMVKKIRINTSRGRPVASDKLMSKIEAKLGKRLRPLPVGRPKREGKK
jgi:putative transposase